jgi:hypothetical protein
MRKLSDKKRLLKQPPIVTPRKFPKQIIREVLDDDERKIMLDHLAVYQRRGDVRQWDEYRQKISVVLLEKWSQVLRKCRENGFVNPVASGDNIFWGQIIGDRTFADKCTLCQCNTGNGSCQGRIDYSNNKKDFVPCWRH